MLVPLWPRNAIDELRPDRFRGSRDIDDILREHHRRRGRVLGGPSDPRVWRLCGLRQTILRLRPPDSFATVELGSLCFLAIGLPLSGSEVKGQCSAN